MKGVRALWRRWHPPAWMSEANPECDVEVLVWNWTMPGGPVHRVKCHRLPEHDGPHFFWLTKPTPVEDPRPLAMAD